MRKKQEYFINFIAILFITLFDFILMFKLGFFRDLDGDMGGYIYGIRAGLAKIISEGEFPFWFPFAWGGVTSGHPYFSTYNPFMLLLEWICIDKNTGILSFSFVFLYHALHYWIFCVGLYFLIAEITKSKFLSGCTILLTGASTLIFFNMFNHDALAMTYMPFVLYFVKKAIDLEKASKWMFLAALFMAFTIELSPSFGTASLLLAYVFFCIASCIKNRNQIMRILLRMFEIGILCICFSAFTLLDMISFTSQSVRQVGDTLIYGTSEKISFTEFTAHPGIFSDLKNVFLGDNGYNIVALNIVLVFLLILGIVYRAQDVWSTYAIIQLVVIILYGCSICFDVIMYYLPVYNQIREQYLYMMMLPLPVTILIAEGLKTIKDLWENKEIRKNNKKIIMAIIIIPLVLSQLLYPQKQICNLILISFLIIGLIVLFKVKRQKICILLCSILVLNIMFTDLYYLKTHIYTGMTSFEAAQLVADIQSPYINLMSTLDNDEEKGWGILRWVDDSPSNILSALGYKDDVPYLNPVMKKIRLAHTFLNMEDRLVLNNVKYIFTPNDTNNEYWIKIFDQDPNLQKVKENILLPSSYNDTQGIPKNIYLNNNRAGVAWFVDSYLTYDEETSLEQVAELLNSEDFTPLTVAAINTSYCSNTELQSIDSLGNDYSVNTDEYLNNSFQLKTESTSNHLLVTSEVFADGWKCYIDGKENNIIEVNYGYMGTIVPSGIHKIEFVFRPPHLILEFLLMIFGILYILVIYVCEHNEKLRISLLRNKILNFSFRLNALQSQK